VAHGDVDTVDEPADEPDAPVVDDAGDESSDDELESPEPDEYRIPAVVGFEPDEVRSLEDLDDAGSSAHGRRPSDGRPNVLLTPIDVDESCLGEDGPDADHDREP
jgi:hypothetical protein